MEWYIQVLKKYAIFTGRARRKEYWYFILINFFIGILISLLTLFPITEKIFGIVSIGYYLALFIPSLAVCVRRLHDTNRSGFSLFLALIPLAGIIILTIYLIQDGTLEKNQYGENPKNKDVIPFTNNTKRPKKWLVPVLIILSITFMILFFYFGFRSIGSKEQFAIINTSNNNYYLNIVSNKSISQFSFNRYIEINGINYYYIIKTGQYKLRGARNIFQSKRNDEIDIYVKLKDIFSVFKIIDDNDIIIWDLHDENSEKITRIEHPFGTIFWILSIE